MRGLLLALVIAALVLPTSGLSDPPPESLVIGCCGLAGAQSVPIARGKRVAKPMPQPTPPCSGPISCPSAPQADWKLVGEGSTSVSKNRIYYARVPSETKRWQARLSSYDRDTNLQQDFGHTGLLAIFLTSRTVDFGFMIGGVFASTDGSLTVQIRNPVPSPWPLPSCDPEPTVSCPAIPAPLPSTPLYVLIAIRKGSLPAPITKLHISETTG